VTRPTAAARLTEELLGSFTAGSFSVGDRFPTEAELCDRSGLGRGTVRDALRRIEELGMIDRRPGAGTRVVSVVPLEGYQPVAATTDDIARLVERTTIHHPTATTVTADEGLAQRLGAEPGSTWYLVEGPRVLRGRRQLPLCWSEQYLDASRPGRDELHRGDVASGEGRGHTIDQTVSAALLDDPIAGALQATAGSAALVVTRRRLDRRNRLVSVGIHTHPADRYQLKTVVRSGADQEL
jgi:GntR family transcriptional regulator